MRIINDMPSMEGYAKMFMTELDIILRAKNTHLEMTSGASDWLFETFAEVTPGGGFVVRPLDTNGIQADIFDGMESHEWFQHMYNPTGDFTGISLWTVDEARKWFLEALSFGMLNNVPHEKEEAIKHIKRHIYSLFNGANRFNLQFDLIYVDYSIFDGEYAETMNLGDLLIV